MKQLIARFICAVAATSFIAGLVTAIVTYRDFGLCLGIILGLLLGIATLCWAVNNA